MGTSCPFYKTEKYVEIHTPHHISTSSYAYTYVCIYTVAAKTREVAIIALYVCFWLGSRCGQRLLAFPGKKP
jgi:hypothetical protein